MQIKTISLMPVAIAINNLCTHLKNRVLYYLQTSHAPKWFRVGLTII